MDIVFTGLYLLIGKKAIYVVYENIVPKTTSYLQFFKGKATSCSDFCVVFCSWCSNNRSQHATSRSRSNSLCFFHPVVSPPLFPCWLIEPCFDPTLPVFVEVPIGHHIISFRRHICSKEKRKATKYSANYFLGHLPLYFINVISQRTCLT